MSNSALHPLLLRFHDREAEREFSAREADRFSVHLPTLICVLAVMNVTRIILYSVDNKEPAELGWSVSVLVVSLCLRCLLWVPALKFAVVAGAEALLYLTCVEWVVSFSSFFCFQVRAIIVALGMLNVYNGMFLFAWSWPLYFLEVSAGTVYLVLRTNLHFSEQDVPSQVMTAALPAVAVYLHLSGVKEGYYQSKAAKSSSEKWEALVTSLPGHVVVLSDQTTLFINPSASEFLQTRDPAAVLFPQVHALIKSCTKRNSEQRFEEVLRELLAAPHPSDVPAEATFKLTRDDNSHYFLQVFYRQIPWERKSKAVILTFTNITRVLSSQLQEGKGEVLALIGTCTTDMLRPGLIRTAGELRLKQKGTAANLEAQLLCAYYGLYCLEDLQKVLSGSELKVTVKSVNMRKEMEKIREISQPLFSTYGVNCELQVVDLPEVVKIDQIRYREFVCLVLQALVPVALKSSKLELTVSPKTGLLSNELLVTVLWAQDAAKGNCALMAVAEKLARKLGAEGLKAESNKVTFSFFAGFVPDGANLRK